MNVWVRLWHEMPTDPKWRVVARKSGRPTSEIIAIFTMMLVNASQSSERGTLENWSDEDAAAALDMETEHVTAIREAMQGIVLDGCKLTEWYMRNKKRINDQRPSAEVWAKIRSLIFERDDYTCKYCGKRGVKLECDHVFPVSRGGSNRLDNLVTACLKCNRSKRAKTLEEWRAM